MMTARPMASQIFLMRYHFLGSPSCSCLEPRPCKEENQTVLPRRFMFSTCLTFSENKSTSIFYDTCMMQLNKN